ncbi:MAG: hypothetical protein IT200_18400 [Thermoleophilia bacterium]|nr:hypothetical protein [Thermoleophilia bacterium]
MPILNYTTTIDATKTLAEIQALLARHGARAIQIDYDGQGAPVALAFQAETPIGRQAYRLPANIDAVFAVLTRQHQRGSVQRRFVTREQAARVGWRILKDWVQAQLAIIETQMTTLDEVMLPWLIAGRDGQTVYQLYAQRQLALPGAAGKDT